MGRLDRMDGLAHTQSSRKQLIQQSLLDLDLTCSELPFVTHTK